MNFSKTIFRSAVIFGCLAAHLNLASAQLPPAIQADRFLLAAQDHVANGDHSEAVIDYEKILALDVEVPDNFWFFYSQSLTEIERFKDAEDSLVVYLTAAGKSGENYKEALVLLNEIEPKAKDEVEKEKVKAEEAERNALLKTAISANGGICQEDMAYEEVTKTHKKTVTVQPSAIELISVPAVFDLETETIIVKPAAPEGTTFKLEEEVLLVVQEAHAQYEITPAVFSTKKITVDFGADAEGRPMTTEENIRFIKTPAKSKAVVVPAVTKAFSVYEIKKRGKSDTMLEAEVKEISRRVVKTPAKTEERKIPAVTKQSQFNEVERAALDVEADVICDYKTNVTLVNLLQSELIKTGDYEGEENGTWDEGLSEAIVSFQKRKALAVGPFMSTEMLQELNVEYE